MEVLLFNKLKCFFCCVLSVKIFFGELLECLGKVR